MGRAVGFIVLEGGNNEGDDDEADMEGTGDAMGGIYFPANHTGPIQIGVIETVDVGHNVRAVQHEAHDPWQNKDLQRDGLC